MKTEKLWFGHTWGPMTRRAMVAVMRRGLERQGYTQISDRHYTREDPVTGLVDSRARLVFSLFKGYGIEREFLNATETQ